MQYDSSLYIYSLIHTFLNLMFNCTEFETCTLVFEGPISVPFSTQMNISGGTITFKDFFSKSGLLIVGNEVSLYLALNTTLDELQMEGRTTIYGSQLININIHNITATSRSDMIIHK